MADMRRLVAVGAFRLDRVVAFCVLATLAFTIVAAPLMVLHVFRPLPVAVGTLLLTALLFRGWVRAVPRDEPGRALAGGSAPLRIALACLLVGSGVSGLVFSSEHVETGRDPGVYVNAGRTLAEDGTLLVDPDVAGFEPGEVSHYEEGVDEPLIFASGGYYNYGHRSVLPEDRLYPRFFHALSAILAAGQWIGGPELLVRMNALLGVVALLVIFAFAARVTRPWLALAATAALAVNLVQVYFQRDAYTEILTQVFLFGGLWALWEATRHLKVERGLIAGLVLGATCFVRVDSFLYLAPIAAALVVHLWRTARRRPRWYQRHRRFVIAVVGGMLLTGAAGVLQGFLLSPPYVVEFRRFLLALGALPVAVVLLGGWAVLRHRARFRELGRRYRRHRRLIALTVGTAIFGGVVLLYVRPEIVVPGVDFFGGETWRGLVEGFPEEAAEPLPRKVQQQGSMWWLGWYLGPLGLVAGIVGWARGWWEAVMGRGSRMLPFLLAFSATIAGYLWRPMIGPDHVWAMRRFLPMALPGLFVLGMWLVGRLWDELGDRRPALRAVAAVLLAGTLAFSSWTVALVPTARAQRTLDSTERLCEQIPDGAGVLVAHDNQLTLRLTQAIRGFCGVPTAYTPGGLVAEDYRELAERWTARGGTLYVLSPNPHALGFEGMDLRFRQVVSMSYEELERRFLGRPTSLEAQQVDLYLAPL